MSNANKLIKPKWKLHHLNNNPEHDLFETYIVEYTDISGIEIDYYIRSEAEEFDDLYGETTETRYLDPIRTKLIYEITDEISSTTPFGIVSEEIIQYASMPKFTFSRDVSAGYNPKPGDVFTTIWNNRNYEIVDVGEEEKIFQLRKMIWGFVVRPYRFSSQSDSAKEILESPDDLLTNPMSGYGNNDFIDEESEDIDDYSDVDTDIYGY